MKNPGFMVAENRAIKAKKIESIILHFLDLKLLEDKKILDIGCGNGEIINYFTACNHVYACDVNDQLDHSIREKIEFKLIDSTLLPYPNNYFDVVITNHVIEHVDNPFSHLKEISRVLKKDGLCFFSTPNKYYPVEPHHKIPLIHYLPHSFFIFLLKKLGQYQEPLKLLSYLKMKHLFRKARFTPYEYTSYVLKYPELFHWDGMSLRHLPMQLVKLLQPFSQTNIFILTPEKSE